MTEQEFLDLAVAVDGMVGDGKRWRFARRRPLSLFRRSHRNWRLMIRCCYDTNHPLYPKFGGRGVGVSKLWASDWQTFYSHFGPPPSATAFVKRLDRNGNFVPGNVVWAEASK